MLKSKKRERKEGREDGREGRKKKKYIKITFQKEFKIQYLINWSFRKREQKTK